MIMIHLSRDRELHQIEGKQKYVIYGGLRGHHLRTKCRKLLDHRRTKGQFSSSDFNRDYWKPAKEQLLAETHQKCAYCESPTSVVTFGDVEHYRPKSEYWWLAYCYDNYLASCQICNNFKSNYFPVEGPRLQEPPIHSGSTDAELDDWQTRLCPDPVQPEEGYTHAQYLADHETERPLLLNPYLDEPKDLLTWEVIPLLEEVWLAPLEGDDFSARVVEAMDEYYGLNREELLHWRFKRYKQVKRLADDIKDPRTHPDVVIEKKADLKAELEPDEQYTGMARYFVEKVWQITLD
jgi:hypothetical protein